MKYDEGRLWSAVIIQAIQDLLGKNQKLRKEAQGWINSQSFAMVCDLANLDFARTKNMLNKIGTNKGEFMDFSSSETKSLSTYNIEKYLLYLLPDGKFYQDKFYIRDIDNDRVIVAHHIRKMPKTLLKKNPYKSLSGCEVLRNFYVSKIVIFKLDGDKNILQVTYELKSGKPTIPKIHQQDQWKLANV